MEEYQLEFTLGYTRALKAIEADVDRLDAALGASIYIVLRRDPHRGAYMERTGLFVIRMRVFLGLLMVAIAYRIDDERKVVQLVDIRAIDQSLM